MPFSISTFAGAADIPGNASATDASFIPSDAPAVNAQAAIVMDLDTGDILYEKNAYNKMYPASITKVLTCLIAIEKGNMNDTITISDSVMSQVEDGSSSIGLVSGEKLSFKDTVYGMMLNSGNECALALAENLSGSTEEFAKLMNKRAKELGCKDSNFVNPNGLQNENHYTTCYDMALIGKAAYQYPEFKKIVSSQIYTIPETNLNEARDLWQENRLIFEGNGDYYYEYSTGGKTGYTVTSLATLISFAEKDGKRLVCVVMKCDPTTESYLDSKKLFEYCFLKYTLYRPLMEYDVFTYDKAKNSMVTNFYNDLNHTLPKYYVNRDYSFYIRSFIKDEDVEKEIVYNDDISEGNIGKIYFKYEGEVIGETDITATVPSMEASSTDAIRKANSKPEDSIDIVGILKKIILIIVSLIVFILFIIVFVKIHKWSRIRTVKRNVKYFPPKRDPRLKENQEKQKKEQERKEKQNHKEKKQVENK